MQEEAIATDLRGLRNKFVMEHSALLHMMGF